MGNDAHVDPASQNKPDSSDEWLRIEIKIKCLKSKSGSAHKFGATCKPIRIGYCLGYSQLRIHMHSQGIEGGDRPGLQLLASTFRRRKRALAPAPKARPSGEPKPQVDNQSGARVYFWRVLC